MQKDVIYIDVEDDITAIIGKVKAAKHKIVALVPPKRVGVLQSAVNLRLVNRAASQKDKRLVIITNNQALASLAAAATIPVAKTLQSKPELAPIDAIEVDDGEDIIDGSDLPVGEHIRQSGSDDEASAAVATAGLAATSAGAAKASPPANPSQVKPKVKRGPVVPNFSTFRKKMVLIVVAVVLLIGFLVWALVFAPRAKVVVLTRTTDAAVSQLVNLVTGARTSVSGNTIEAVSQTVNNDVSVSFEATGERNVGEFAKGTVTFSSDSNSLLLRSPKIPAGTQLTSSSGAAYTTDSEVSLSVFNSSGTTGITAVERGERYNGATGAMSGAPARIDAKITTATAGGTDRTVKVATKSDIDKARDRALAEVDKAAALRELTTKFGDGFVVLDDSLQVDTSALKSSVAVDAEAANGQAKYGGKVSFTLYGVAKSELEDYLKAVLNQQIDNPDRQRVYETGASSVNFTNVDRADSGVRATLSTNGKIGPTIDEGEIKELAAGKRIGDIKSAIEGINGVRSVDVELSPFWVTKAPASTEKIRVEFKLDE